VILINSCDLMSAFFLQEEQPPTMLSFGDLNAAMADVALEIATRMFTVYVKNFICFSISADQ
jgi:hypothetical protein